MRTTRIRHVAIAVLLVCVPLCPPAQEGAVKQRIEQRLPAIDSLKVRRLVGENNGGYIEARGKLTPDEARLVEQENGDRDSVYESIARKFSTTKEAVGRKRAEQIALYSARGVWVQDAGGAWSEKK